MILLLLPFLFIALFCFSRWKHPLATLLWRSALVWVCAVVRMHCIFAYVSICLAPYNTSLCCAFFPRPGSSCIMMCVTTIRYVVETNNSSSASNCKHVMFAGAPGLAFIKSNMQRYILWDELLPLFSFSKSTSDTSNLPLGKPTKQPKPFHSLTTDGGECSSESEKHS